jgi:hypothetical protein
MGRSVKRERNCLSGQTRKTSASSALAAFVCVEAVDLSRRSARKLVLKSALSFI